VTPSYVCSYVCVDWNVSLPHMCDMTHPIMNCILRCVALDVTPSYVCSMCVHTCVYMCAMIHSSTNCILRCVTLDVTPSYVCSYACSYVWHDSVIYERHPTVRWLRRGSFICVFVCVRMDWNIPLPYMCDMTYLITNCILWYVALDVTPSYVCSYVCVWTTETSHTYQRVMSHTHIHVCVTWKIHVTLTFKNRVTHINTRMTHTWKSHVTHTYSCQCDMKDSCHTHI